MKKGDFEIMKKEWTWYCQSSAYTALIAKSFMFYISTKLVTDGNVEFIIIFHPLFSIYLKNNSEAWGEVKLLYLIVKGMY